MQHTFRIWGPQECSVEINTNAKIFSLGRYAPSHNILQNIKVNIVENLYSVGIS